MKRLYLLRHAKSAWDDPVARDFDRPLNKKGHRAGRTMGEEMRRRGLAFDAVVASPAMRVVETLAVVSQGLGTELAPRFDERIYLAAPETLLDIVHEADDDAGSLLLAGHSPGIERLALQLAGRKDARLRAAIEEKFPTGALAELEFAIERWKEVRKGEAALTHFTRPRDLDPELGPEY